MTKIYFGVSPKTVEDVAQQIEEKSKDSVLVLAPPNGKISVSSPTKTGKNKNFHRIQTEILIPKDAIIGDLPLDDFGLVSLLRLPKPRIQPHLITSKKEKVDSNQTNTSNSKTDPDLEKILLEKRIAELESQLLKNKTLAVELKHCLSDTLFVTKNMKDLTKEIEDNSSILKKENV